MGPSKGVAHKGVLANNLKAWSKAEREIQAVSKEKVDAVATARGWPVSCSRQRLLPWSSSNPMFGVRLHLTWKRSRTTD